MWKRIAGLFLVLAMLGLPVAAGCNAAMNWDVFADAEMACCASHGGCGPSLMAEESRPEELSTCLCTIGPSLPPADLTAHEFSRISHSLQAPNETPTSPIEPFSALSMSVSSHAPPPSFGTHTYLRLSIFRI